MADIIGEAGLSAADAVFEKLLADDAAPSPAQAVSALIRAIDARASSMIRRPAWT